MTHDHDHSHDHAPADFSRAFAIGTGLNLAFVLVEGGYGFMANSLALVADAAVSAGVVDAGFGIMATGWNWLDPLISMAISLVVLVAGWGLLRDSLHLTMAGVPAHIKAEAVLDYLTGLPGVQCVHDLHIWAASTTETVLTAHLVMPAGGEYCFLNETAEHLRHDFDIHHTTLQIEVDDGEGLCHINDKNQGCCCPGKAATPDAKQTMINTLYKSQEAPNENTIRTSSRSCHDTVSRASCHLQGRYI